MNACNTAAATATPNTTPNTITTPNTTTASNKNGHRTGLLVFSSLYTFLFAGAFFGWGPMQLMLEENGSLSSKCNYTNSENTNNNNNNSDEDEVMADACPEQTAALLRIQFIALLTILLSPLFGIVFDRYGTMILVYIMTCCVGIALLSLFLATYYFIDPLLYVAFVHFGIVAYIMTMLSIQTGICLYPTTTVTPTTTTNNSSNTKNKNNERKRSQVISLLNTLFDAGSITYLGLWGIQKLTRWSLSSITILYAMIAIICFTGGIYYWKIVLSTCNDSTNNTCSNTTTTVATAAITTTAEEQEQSSSPGEHPPLISIILPPPPPPSLASSPSSLHYENNSSNNNDNDDPIADCEIHDGRNDDDLPLDNNQDVENGKASTGGLGEKPILSTKRITQVADDENIETTATATATNDTLSKTPTDAFENSTAHHHHDEPSSLLVVAATTEEQQTTCPVESNHGNDTPMITTATSTEQQERQQPFHIKIAHRTPRQQLLSEPFLMLSMYFGLHVTYNAYTLTTTRDFLGYLGDDDVNNKYLTIFTALLPVSVFALPLVDQIIERFGFYGGFQIINLVCVCHTTIKLVSTNLNVQIIGFVIFTLYRCFLFSITLSYLPKLVSNSVIGKGVGIMSFSAGVASFINYPVSMIAIKHRDGNFFISNLIIGLLVIPCLVATWRINVTVKKEEKADKYLSEE